VFWINVPVGALGMLLVAWLIPPTESERPPAPDLPGMAMIGGSLTALMVGIETLGRGVLPAVVPVACVAGGLALFWLTVRHCRRAPHPAIDFELLRIPTFHAATVAGSLFRAGAGSLPFLVPLTLQVGFGLNATTSGLITLASALGSFCMRPMTRFALRRFAVRTVLIAGSITFAAMLAACSMLSSAWPEIAIFALLLAGGLSRSLAFASMGALAFADVEQERLSAATSFQGTAQQMMKAVGVAVAAGSMQLTMLFGGRSHPAHADFSCAFLVMAAVVLVSWPLFGRLSVDAGEGISGAKRRAA
jgi:hypothetical protein